MKGLNRIKGWMSLITIKKMKALLGSKWVIFGVGPLLILMGVAFVIWAGNLLTTHPVICLSCHARQSSLPMWSLSQIHPERVSCVDCHAKPGPWFPRFFYADERVNDNCFSCHPRVAKDQRAEAHHMKIAHKLHIEEPKMLCIVFHRS